MEDNGEPLLSRELIEQAQAGDGNAFRLLVERSQPRLEVLAYVRMSPALRRMVEVDDVLQETYLRVNRFLGRFTYESSAGTFRWLETILERVIMDFARYFRRKRRNGDPSKNPVPPSSGGNGISLLDLIPAPVTTPSRILQRRERFERLERALNSLSPEYREVLILARVHVLPIREIASRMGRTEAAVGMLLTRAARKIQEAFGTTDSWHLPASGLLKLLELPGTSESAENGDGGGEGPSASPPPPPAK